MHVIVGLGNPGFEYEKTRHNLGFMTIDSLCARMRGVKLKETSRTAVYASFKWQGQPIILAKPTTYMNSSGLAVREILSLVDTAPSEILVVADDLALPLGMVRVRGKGGSGGHNGIESIIREIGTNEFPRVRIGIGSPGEDSVEFVLSEFLPDEWKTVEEGIASATEAVMCFLREGTAKAMQRFNKRVPLSEPEGDAGQGSAGQDGAVDV